MAPAGRRLRGRNPTLSEGVIVDVAQRLLREEGIEAVTMRRVADALGSGAASLYVHISGRDELLAAVLERVVATVPLAPPDPSRWREQIVDLASSLRSALRAHPGLATVAAADPAADEPSLVVIENLLSLLRAGGLDRRRAAWAGTSLFLLAIAGALDAEPGDSGPAGSDGDGSGAFLALSPERFPHLSGLEDELAPEAADARFRFMVEAVLRGLAGAERDVAGSPRRAGEPPPAAEPSQP